MFMPNAHLVKTDVPFMTFYTLFVYHEIMHLPIERKLDFEFYKIRIITEQQLVKSKNAYLPW